MGNAAKAIAQLLASHPRPGTRPNTFQVEHALEAAIDSRVMSGRGQGNVYRRVMESMLDALRTVLHVDDPARVQYLEPLTD